MKKKIVCGMIIVMCMTLAGYSEKEEKKAAASLTFKDDTVEVMQGDEVDVKDFIKSVEGKVKYPKLDTSEAGEQVLKYVVTGEDGKKKTYELTVNVKAKEETANTQTPEEAPAEEQTEPQTPTTQTPTATPPAANTRGSNGSTTTGSSGGNTTTSPTPPAQNVCVPDGTYTNLDNSGMWFNSQAEAEAWAEAQLADPNSPWYQYRRYLWTTGLVKDSCGEIAEGIYTVHFFKE